MLKPTTGELLAGITEGLRTGVLPELADGHGRRQLKAALHALARLQRAWHSQPALLAADSEDMHSTLRSVLDTVRLSEPSHASHASFVESMNEKLIGLQTAPTSLPAQEAVNAELQALLITLDDWLHAPAQDSSEVCRAQRATLAGLFSRMVDRELAGSGVTVETP